METYSLELEEDLFIEPMAMIRVKQIRVLLISNIGGLLIGNLQYLQHLSPVRQGKCTNNY